MDLKRLFRILDGGGVSAFAKLSSRRNTSLPSKRSAPPQGTLPGALLGGAQHRGAPAGTAAFTLVEIMVVAAIMMITLTIGVPIVYKTFHKPPLAKAITDVVDICSAARARAILQGSMTRVVFHPRDGRLEVRGASDAHGPGYTGGGLVEVSTPGSRATLSAQFSEHVMIDMLDIELSEYKEAEEAHVRFYPNGRCDEMTLILRGEGGQQRGVTLEITTSLPNILNEDDLQRLRR